MTDVLAELRQAEATIIRMRDAAFPQPWSTFSPGARGGDHWYVTSENEAILSVSANDGDDEDLREPTAELVVLSVSVLVEAVLPIIQDALHHTWPLDDETHSKWIDDQHPAALRLARAINERTAS